MDQPHSRRRLGLRCNHVDRATCRGLERGILGVLIMCCSAIALCRYDAWAEWSNLILGCWTVVAPFLLGFASAQTPMWTHVVLGLCVASIATVQLLASRRAHACSSTRSAPR